MGVLFEFGTNQMYEIVTYLRGGLFLFSGITLVV